MSDRHAGLPDEGTGQAQESRLCPDALALCADSSGPRGDWKASGSTTPGAKLSPTSPRVLRTPGPATAGATTRPGLDRTTNKTGGLCLQNELPAFSAAALSVAVRARPARDLVDDREGDGHATFENLEPPKVLMHTKTSDDPNMNGNYWQKGIRQGAARGRGRKAL